MNRSSRRLTKRQAEQKARRMMSYVHILIAVVAIIECILLVSFTTYSWIESNSSLVIQNGPASAQDDPNNHKKIAIADTLNSTLLLNDKEPMQELKDFFSEVKYFEFAKATTSDGKTFFFPYRNNTYASATKYRKGDTDDYNTAYLYFDFIIDNRDNGEEVDGVDKTYSANNLDVYFENEDGYDKVFNVTGEELTPEQLAILRNAMRMSITTQVDAANPNTKIYSYESYSTLSGADHGTYNSFAPDQANPTDDTRNTAVSTYRISDYVFAENESGVVTSEKLFVAKKNAKTKVSVRIWFELNDPAFRETFVEESEDFYNTSIYKKIVNADIGIKFAFKTNGNDLRSLYFDDYTFSNSDELNCNHVTDEIPANASSSADYRVWFYAWQPAVQANADHPQRDAGFRVIPLEPDRTNAGYTRWSVNDALGSVTQSMMAFLMGDTENNYTDESNSEDNPGTRYLKAYFCYGDYSTMTALYKWELSSKPLTDGDFTFNAFSYRPNDTATNNTAWNSASTTTWQNCNGTWKKGVGIWQDDSTYTTMKLLKFRDMTTAVTAEPFNQPGVSGGSVTVPNSKFVNAQGVDHSKNVLYVNNINAAGDNSTPANNFNATVSQTVSLGSNVSTVISSVRKDGDEQIAAVTAAMYYDTDNEVFQSYVPAYWLTGDYVGNNRGVSFTFSSSGVFGLNEAAVRWYNDTPVTLNNEYIYTALGYSNSYDNSGLGYVGYTAFVYGSAAGYLRGVGTWSDVEEIKFNTDLIDTDLSANYRYFVGYSDSFSAGYYAMIPDATNMTFSAYVPFAKGRNSDELSFIRYNAAKTAAGTVDVPSVYWYGNTRYTNTIFYPVDCDDDDATVEYTHGYWNLSVLVDGTYENLIYDSLHNGGTGNSTYALVTTSETTNYTYTIDYSARKNYGLLQYSYTGQANSWVTVADDLTDTYSGELGRYRYYAPAENPSTQSTVYWRWIPYDSYSVTFFQGVEGHEVTVFGSATQFDYIHDVSDTLNDGIYLVVTEAENDVDTSALPYNPGASSGSGGGEGGEGGGE